MRPVRSVVAGAARRPLILGLFLLLALAGLTADRARSDAQPLDLGEENSWIRIQNVGSAAAKIEITFFDADGRELARDGCPSDTCSALTPGLGWSFFQQGLDALAVDYRGSAHIEVDQPFVALLARDVFKNGDFQIAGDTLRMGAGSPVQYAPLVQNTAAFVSRLSIENSSADNAGCFEIRYYSEGATVAAVVDPPGPTPGCPNGGHLVPPRGTLLRDEQSLPLPADFDGAAIVRSYDTASGVPAKAQLPSLIVDTRDRTAPGLATYRGFADDELSTTLVLPQVDRNASDGQSTRTTRFRIFNATPAIPNEVTLLFTGTDGAGDRLELEHTITVMGVRTCDQRLSGAAGCLPDGESLPDVFFGSVRIQSVHPVAVVVQRRSDDGSLADYRGFTVEEASREVILPLLNKNFGPWGDSRGWNSWFRILSFDGSKARVYVLYFSKEFPAGRIVGPDSVDPSRTFRQWENTRLPDGWVGGAIVIADRPVVVVVNLESDVFRGDPVMLYNGVSLE